MISSGNQEIDTKDFYPSMVINEVERYFETFCKEKKIQLITELPETIPEIKIHTDSELIHKILKNLMDNALKFTMTGSITLGCKVKERDFLFYVKDTGKGIS